MSLKEKIINAGAHLLGILAQEQAHHDPVKTVTPGMPELLRHAAAQGAVLLENRVLPFAPGTKVAAFGRVQVNWFCAGYGSGGDVNMPYKRSLLEGLRSCEDLQPDEALAQKYETWCAEHPIEDSVWGMWPRYYPEMPLEQAQIQEAAKRADHAVVVIGRSSGEDRECVLEKGSYYLTDEERNLLKEVTAAFPDTVLILNIGSVMDMSFLKEFHFGAVLLAWQGGMESGNAIADLLCGRENPSGRLTDTIAIDYKDYPSADHFGDRKRNEYYEDIYVGYRWFESFRKDRVLYPFGHGLSYTSFSKELLPQENALRFQVRVTNTGSRGGQEAVLLYVSKPMGVLGNPARELVAFTKTPELAPGESCEVTLEAGEYALSSFDDSGATGSKNCYVLQRGTYRFFLGGSVREAIPAGEYVVEALRVLERLQEASAPEEAFPICAADEAGSLTERTAAPKTKDLAKAILEALPKETFITGDKGYKLKDVKEGRVDLNTFVAQLSLDELEAISRGAYIMGHPWGPKGNAGIFGGVTESLKKKGIPPVVTTDGPSGIRLYACCSLVPIGTMLACTYDTALVERIYSVVGEEMVSRRTDVLLAPGMNIHRDPLCGRNFEYYSEDPLVSGKMAAAVVRGVQRSGRSACPKHFACNNQETNRNQNDSVLSQRALREIYLKGFEICVKEAAPKNLMTSYNKINGVWGHYNFDLVKTILRDEWGYKGNVITDWWMRYAPSPEFPKLTGNAYRVRARVDVLMPGARSFMDKSRKSDGTLLATYGKEDGITLGEMQEAAKNVLRCVMDLKEL